MTRTHGITHFDPDLCEGCKISTLSFGAPVFKPHFNWAVGQYVNNDREYRDALKSCAERNSLSTGLDHNYEPRYPGEVEPIREADQAVEDHLRAKADG